MKWNVDPVSAKEGDTRIVRKWALLPTQVENKMVWLETYETQETYQLNLNYKGGGRWEETHEYVSEQNTIVYPHRKLLYFTVC